MVTKKDIALEKSDAIFEDFANIIKDQLQLLEQYINLDAEDLEIKKKIYENEDKIDNLEIRIDNQVIKTIVLYKPVAGNLRHLLATYRMVINLERVGDYIIKIIRKVDKVRQEETYAKSKKFIVRFAHLSLKMVEDAIKAFESQDKDLAVKVIRDDANIDDMYKKVVVKVINNFKENENINELFISFSEIRSILSTIERLSNQASNIAEISIYSILGVNVKHQDIEDFEV